MISLIISFIWLNSYVALGLTVVGLAFIIASLFINILYKYPSLFMGIILFGLGLYTFGYIKSGETLNNIIKDYESRLEVIKEESNIINESLVKTQEELDKARSEVRIEVQREIVEVERVINGKCKVDQSVIRLHNKAVGK